MRADLLPNRRIWRFAAFLSTSRSSRLLTVSVPPDTAADFYPITEVERRAKSMKTRSGAPESRLPLLCLRVGREHTWMLPISSPSYERALSNLSLAPTRGFPGRAKG